MKILRAIARALKGSQQDARPAHSKAQQEDANPSLSGEMAKECVREDQVKGDLNTHYAPVFAGLPINPDVQIRTSPRATRSLVIAMLPRTGSTMLCQMLAQTRVLGIPDEWLNPGGAIQMYATKLATPDFEAYWDAILRVKRSPNGVFGLKGDYTHFQPLIVRDAMDAYLPAARFVYLTRRDLLGQAISIQRAATSGLWHQPVDGSEFGGRQNSAPVYDRAAINAQLAFLQLMEGNWTAYFATRGIEPLRLFYEEVAADPLEAVRRCVDFMGVADTARMTGLKPTMRRLADALNDDWRRRYEAGIEF